MFFKIDILKSRNIHKKTPLLESLFHYKRDSDTGVLLWI